MTDTAIRVGLEVGRRLTGRIRAIVTGGARRQPWIVMVDGCRNPSRGLVAGATFRSGGNVCGGLGGSRHRSGAPVVAISTGGGQTFEHALDVATLAGGIGVSPGKLEESLVVIEVDIRPLTFCSHQ